MKAIVFDSQTVSPKLVEKEMPVPGLNEVVIKVKAAALNHRDLHLTNPNNKSEFVYGSDGAGIIVSVGEEVNNWKIGEEVIINSQISCLKCDYCLKGDHSLCEHERVLGGISWSGTFAEYVKVPAVNIEKKPEHLTFQEAAGLPLALGTAWRTLITKAELKPGEKLLIQGIGGGVALFCLQLAVSMGVEVFVTSGSSEKIKKAIELGAKAGINYRKENVVSKGMELTKNKGFDVSISSNGNAITESLDLANKGGRIVQFAYIGEKLPSFNVDLLMGKQLKLMGSSMHTYSEFKEAIHFVNEVKMKPIISSIYPLDDFSKGFSEMKDASQFGKIVYLIE